MNILRRKMFFPTLRQRRVWLLFIYRLKNKNDLFFCWNGSIPIDSIVYFCLSPDIILEDFSLFKLVSNLFRYVLNLSNVLLKMKWMINDCEMEIVLLEQEDLYSMRKIHQEVSDVQRKITEKFKSIHLLRVSQKQTYHLWSQ
jgi:hypothetical protein